MPATPTPSASAPEKTRRFRLARMGWLTLLAVVLVLAFIGYQSPDMRVQWAAFASFCGF